MGRPDLLDSDDEEGNKSSNIVINKRYAKDFQLRKQREDLRNTSITLSDEDDDDDDASTSSDEDEHGNLLTTKLDTDIMKTINALRLKDARIYDPRVRFFASDDQDKKDEDANDDDDDESNRDKKRKPKRYKDVVREQALEKIEKGSDNESDDDDDNDERKSHRLIYDQEQEEIRKSFLHSTKEIDEGSKEYDDNEDGLLVVKKKNPKENEEDEEEFVKEVQRIESTMGGKESDYVDPKGEVDNGSKFLLNFFKNRAWIDKDKMDDDEEDSEEEDETAIKVQLAKTQQTEADEEVPMKTGDKNDGNESDTSLNQLDKTDDFEAQYNFRFEEAAGSQSGADFSLISYARGQMVNTLRRKDETRREKRLARKERKTAERKAKEEELKRLKNLKRKEMERKMKEVKQVVGLADQDTDLDEAAILKLIEGDYDPEEFEKKMQATFGDDFYSTEDKEWKSDNDVRSALLKDEDGNLIVGQDDEGDMYDTIGDNAEDDEGASEEKGDEEWADEEHYEENEAYEDGEDGEEETELEKKIKAKMEDELYKLDYEDIVAGMPTRFKYRQVEPNNFGLTTEEILFARDTSLKQYVSLKKMAPYREDGEFAVGGRRRRRFRDMLKQEIKEEMGASEKQSEAKEQVEAEAEAEAEGTSKKRKRRRSKKNKSADKNGHERSDNENVPSEESKTVSTKESAKEEAEKDVEDAGEKEPKRKRRRRKKKKSSSTADDQVSGPEPDVEMGKNLTKDVNDDVEEKTKSEVKETSPTKSYTVDSKDAQKEGSKSDHDKAVPKKAKKKEKKHKTEKNDERKRDKKKKKKTRVDGISNSRLSSYGL